MIRSQRFFNKISFHFQNLIKKSEILNEVNIIKAIIEPRIGERVLDIGNGGVRQFCPPQTSFYVGVDFSLEMLKRGENRTYYKVCAEAMDLPFKEGGFNSILYLYLLHHLAKGSIGTTIEEVKKTLKEGATCLKTGGNIIIAETCIPSFMERVEKIFFSILRIFLLFTKQPEVFFFSAETLARILAECGYREIRTWKVSGEKESPWKWVRISIGFPNLKIPRWMNPSRSTILEAKN
jgi:SAM-dependent methyltransferase